MVACCTPYGDTYTGVFSTYIATQPTTERYLSTANPWLRSFTDKLKKKTGTTSLQQNAAINTTRPLTSALSSRVVAGCPEVGRQARTRLDVDKGRVGVVGTRHALGGIGDVLASRAAWGWGGEGRGRGRWGEKEGKERGEEGEKGESRRSLSEESVYTTIR